MTDHVSTPPDDAPRSTASPLDRAFEMLKHPQRRRILTALETAESPAKTAFTSSDLLDGDGASDQQLIELYHIHLPRLDEAGYVDWDQDADVVRPGPHFEEIAPVVTLLRENRDELPAEWV